MQKFKNGIVIQARMGSTRLPQKMARAFSDGKTLLELVLHRLYNLHSHSSLIVATTTSESDSYIKEISHNNGYLVYCGSEKDVLSRFIDAAEYYGIKNIIRVCADNPFIQLKYFDMLVDSIDEYYTGYTGFRLNGKIPAIKSHFGFFPELVSLSALKMIDQPGLTDTYREHVTNYFYGASNTTVPVKWIDIEIPDKYLDTVRLTIDTENDLLIADRIYNYLKTNNLKGTVEEIFHYLDHNPEIVSEMQKIIQQNEK